MATDSSSRRNRSRLRLRIRSADPVEDSDDSGLAQRTLPPKFAAGIGGIGTGLLSWLAVTILVLVGWGSARADTWDAALGAATQVWLSAYGGGMRLGGARWTLIPLGLTTFLFLLTGFIARWVLRRLTVVADDTVRPALEVLTVRQLRWLVVLLAVGHGILVGTIAFTSGSPGQGLRATAGACVLGLAAGLWGAARTTDLGWTALLPGWARAIPAAVGTALWTVLLGGTIVVAIALIRQHTRVSSIAGSLGTDPASAVGMTVGQLLFWPNLIVWAGSWALGAGFRLGTGTIVSPAATDLGLLPSVPVLGALPAEGPGRWLLAWLAIGAVAGILASVVVQRRTPGASLEVSVGASTLAGVLAAVAYTLLGALSGGDLGAGRLVGTGPRLRELLLLGGALLGLSALVTGLTGALVRAVRRRRTPRAGVEEAEVSEGAASAPVSGTEDTVGP